MAGFEGQTVLSVHDLGLMAVSDRVYHAYGAVTQVLAKPADASSLVLIAEKGTWRTRVGFHAGAMPASATVGAVVADGSGSILLAEGVMMALPAPANVTVRGYAADSVLTYYWL